MIKDNIYGREFSSVKLPKLKGRVKITLHNPTTGKNEIVEGENIVTNAVRDIMASNILGGLDYSKMFPLWSNWFGGILCYQNAHEAVEGVISPDNYYCYSQEQNPLIAHAGGTIIDSAHDDDPKRGNPANLSYVYTDTSVKQVWEWTPSHGNGTISALSLTHKDTGDAGLGSDTYNFRNFNPFDNLSNLGAIRLGLNADDNILARFDDSHGISFTIGNDGDFYNLHTCFETNKVTFYIKKLPFEKAGLYQLQTVASTTDEITSTPLIRKFTVETSFNFYMQPYYYFDEENKRMWLFTNVNGINVSGTSGYNRSEIRYSVIDCVEEEEVSHSTITSDAPDLSPLGFSVNTASPYAGSRAYYDNVLKSGNYFYFPITNGVGTSANPDRNVKGFKKINFSNPADQSTVLFNTVQPSYSATMLGGDFIINSGRVCNGSVGYTCFDYLPHATGSDAPAWGEYAFATPHNPSTYCIRLGNGGAGTRTNARYILANKLVNTTKFNLPSSVIKSASQSMIVEYTLTEVEE